LEAHYMHIAKIQEVLIAAYDNTRPTYDVEPLEKCDNEGKVDQNAEEPRDECVLLASLIANLKLDVDENKKIQTQLKKTNMHLTQELVKSKQNLWFCKSELDKYKVYGLLAKTK
ncbi:hypothetical protein Tco_0326497, partial [Tanacetum coccineum]